MAACTIYSALDPVIRIPYPVYTFEKFKSASLFDTRRDAELQVRDYILVRGIDEYYTLEEGDMGPNGRLFKQNVYLNGYVIFYYLVGG